MRRSTQIKRDLILDASVRVFADQPEVTMRAVATEAGVARATMYRYFPDVAALEDALVAEAVDAAKRAARLRIAAATRGGGCNRPMTEHLLGVVGDLVREDARWKVAVTTSHDRTFAEVFGPIVASVLRKAQQREEVLPDVDPEANALAIVALATAAVRSVHQGIEPDRALEPLRRLAGAFAVERRGPE